MRLFIIPLLAAMVGVPTLSPSLPGAEVVPPHQAEGEGDQNIRPGDDQTRRTEAQRRREEAQRRGKSGETAPEVLHITPGDAKTRTNDQLRNEAGKPMTEEERDTKQDGSEARVHEYVVRLKTERPELFKRLDLNGNGELTTEELRGPREQFTKRQQALKKTGDHADTGSRTDRPQNPAKAGRPAQAKGVARLMPAATATDEDVADYLFSE